MKPHPADARANHSFIFLTDDDFPPTPPVLSGCPCPLPPPPPLPPHHQLDGATGDISWSYEATSDGVSEGRALAIDLVGDSTIVVAGFTGGSAASQRGKTHQLDPRFHTLLQQCMEPLEQVAWVGAMALCTVD